jgi:hypothetical protein
MAGVAGFEPAHDGIKTRCLTTWLHPNNVLRFTKIAKKTVPCVARNCAVRQRRCQTVSQSYLQLEKSPAPNKHGDFRISIDRDNSSRHQLAANLAIFADIN